VQNVAVDKGRKPLPLIVSVREPLPSDADDGDRLVITGLGFDGVTENVIGWELPPPGAGLVTTIRRVPADAKSEVLSVANNWLLLTY
jgi:hypothetical protein